MYVAAVLHSTPFVNRWFHSKNNIIKWKMTILGIESEWAAAEKSQEKVIEFYDLKRGYNHFS